MVIRRFLLLTMARGFTTFFRNDRALPAIALSRWLLHLCLACILFSSASEAGTCRSRVVDAVNKQGIEAAIVTIGNRAIRTGVLGEFDLTGTGQVIGVRAPGYLRKQIPITECKGKQSFIELSPFQPKALYLSFWGIGTAAIREQALRLIHKTELNALVIDVKGDRGLIAYRSAVPLATRAGAQKLLTVPDLEAAVASFHKDGIYLIARIVVFKDDPLASTHAELAVRKADGKVWRDRENLAWGDPFKKEVRDYNIDIAVEAARAGFDEIQFDYVRFPDARNVVFSRPNTPNNRVDAITGFLREAQRRLAPYNVFMAVDIFGYVCWNRNDTGIGQKLESVAPYVDYICPMLYPSSFHLGIPGYRNPVANPYEIVLRSLQIARERIGRRPVGFRPWLQAFRDYAFDRRAFEGRQIRDQIRAAESFGSNGWMLWNPRNIYSGQGLMPRSDRGM